MISIGIIRERKHVKEIKNMINCFCCNKEFQFGPHEYQGLYVTGYEITVCRSCYNGNWDGWAPVYEGRFLGHLSERGVEFPKRNGAGWLPRDWPSKYE